MKTRFSLTPSNMFYAAIVSAFFVGQYLMFAEKNAYQTGALAGRITSLVMFPLVAAVAVWFLFRRHVRRSSITFNTVLTLVAIAHFHTVSNEQPPSPRFEGMNELQEMHAHKDEFKKSALATNDPADYADAYWKFSESVQETFDTLSEKSTGTDQQIFKTLGEFFEGTQAAAPQ